MKAGNGKWGQSTESGGKVEGRREEGGKEERGLVQEVNKKKNVGGGGGGGGPKATSGSIDTSLHGPLSQLLPCYGLLHSIV